MIPNFHETNLIRTLGERNGITPLGALMARMVVTAPEYTKSKYNLKELKSLESLVADAVNINIPFNNPVTQVSPLAKDWKTTETNCVAVVDSVRLRTKQASTPRLFLTTLR